MVGHLSDSLVYSGSILTIMSSLSAMFITLRRIGFIVIDANNQANLC